MHSFFHYYVVDTINGVVLGTDDEQKASDCAKSEDYFVIDAWDNFFLFLSDQTKIGEI